MITENIVLVAGVHGVSGYAAAEYWTRVPGTQVFGVSRRSAPLPPGVEGISADLLDRNDLEEKIGKIKGVTHVVFAAYIEKPTAAERSEANVAILENLLDVVEGSSASSLRHIRQTFLPAPLSGRDGLRRHGTRFSTSQTAITFVGDISGRISQRCSTCRQPTLFRHL